MGRVQGSTDHDCPSLDALAAYVAGGDRDNAIALHLDACPRCRRIVSALAAAEYAEAARQSTIASPGFAGARSNAQRCGGSIEGAPVELGDTPPAVIAGQTLGRFTVTRLLGHGGMGEVWAAHDAVLDREVAVKLLRLQTTALGSEPATRLRREAQAMARLRHPNVVAIYDLGSADGQLFCAMELVDGVTLRAWLEQPRPWREVFEVVLGIGRGIAAAHASGLIHRDIKPDNVLITRDGRPQVTDFGLAKLMDVEGHAPVRAPAETQVFADALTEVGTIIGTPAYMPLEQLEGRGVDAQSDQFSFCATAYEALVGARPFVGNTIAELIAAIERGVEPPRCGVPRDVIRCLCRGLAREPERRFASMDALLDALSLAAGRSRRRLRAVAVAAGVVVAASIAAGVMWRVRVEPEESVRIAANSRISEIWSEAQRSQLRAHFVAMTSAFAMDQLAVVLRQLDDYRASWLAARVDAWEATRVRGEQSQDTLERRVACLERMANAMRATVRVLSTITAPELAKARDLVAGLPDIAQCSDLARLRREPALPSTPEGRALDTELHRLEALVRVGRNDEALAGAKAAVDAIERSTDRTQLARAVFNLGWIEANMGRYVEAEAQLRHALELGAAAQDHPLVARIWLRLFSVIGFEQRRADDALALEPAVRAAVLQAGDDPLQKAELAKSVGLVETAKGNTSAARDHFIEARELFVAARGANDFDVALADINIASVALQLGQLDEAQARLESALETFKASDGGMRHPTVGQAHQNLCAVAWRKQDWSASERHCRAAVEIYVGSLGPDHPLTAKSRLYLARALRKLGRLADAQAELQQARAIQERTMPPGNPERIQTDVYLAQIAEQRGNYVEAEALARKALTALRDNKVPEYLHVFTLSELARYVAHRNPAEALDVYDEALRIHLQKPDRDRSADKDTLEELAKVALAAGKPRRALVWFDKMPEAAAQLAEMRRALEAIAR